MEPSVLRAGPPHQIGVDAFQEWMQLGAVEPPVVLHPAAHDGIHPPCEVGKVGADLQVNTPPAYPLTHRFECLPRHRRQERGKYSPVLVPGGAGAEREPQERERLMLIRASPTVVLTVNDPGFDRVQHQPDPAILSAIAERSRSACL